MAQRGLYCLGCGNDLSITPRDRRDIGVNSPATPEPRSRILTLWTALMRQELSCKGMTIETLISDVQNPGKMCRKCFYDYERFSNLQTKLETNLHLYLQKIYPSNIPTVSSNPTVCVTPTRKRTLESDPPPPVKKRAESGLMSNSSSSVVLALDTASPPVTVSFTKIN